MDSTHQPLVSFIIPCYNLPVDMIIECINSILSIFLSKEEREIIIVDDGSSVDIEDILKSHCNEIIYSRKPNGGVSSARNVGIDISRGEYIQFIDGDDYLDASLYDYCLSCVRNEKPDMVLFNFFRNRRKRLKYDIKGPFSGVEYMLYNNIKAAVWGYIFRKDIISELRFVEGVKYGEDEIFTPLLLLKAEKIYYTDTEIYYYRLREGSAINDKSNRKLVKRLNDYEFLILFLHDIAAVLHDSERNALLRRVHQLTMDYIYTIMILTHSYHHIKKRVRRLSGKNLFPLPKRKYTRKYYLFSILSQCFG